jgi:streptogrisin C
LTVAVVAAGLAAMSGASPVQAQEPGGAVPGGSAGVAVPDELRAALERDLGLAGAELDQLLVASAEATALDAELREELGAEFAGSWFDQRTGTLTVAVTAPAAAELATAAGAEATQVSHAEQELVSITEEVAELVEADPAAETGVLSWGVDAPGAGRRPPT